MFWLRLERLLRHAGGFALFLLFARLLGPRDYGIFAFVMAGTAIVESLLPEIAADAIVALRRVEGAHLSTAFLANTAVGLALSMLLYVVAGVFALMSDEAMLGDMFQSLALLPVLSSLTAVPLGLAKRRLSFAPLAISSLFGLVIGGVGGLSLALAGSGPWSLVAQIVTQRFVEVAILWAGAGRMFSLKWSRRHFRELSAVLPPIAVLPGLQALDRQLPRFLVGLLLGPAATGLWVLAAYIPEALSEILLAPGAIIARAEAAAIGCSTVDPQRAMRRTGLIAFPAVLGSVALLEALLPAVLDPYWWGAVIPAQILILATVPAAIEAARRIALLHTGSLAAEANAATLRTVTGLMMAAAAVPFGLVALSLVLLLHSLIAAALSLKPLRDRLGRQMLGSAARPFVGAMSVGGALLAIQGVPYPSFPPFAALALLLASALTAYAVIVWPAAPVPRPGGLAGELSRRLLHLRLRLSL
ncbi:MAG: oligosaccharide flippase family protein [Alphaproteobacteria bacterium]|nr:oligosaccharide flippase family protein [Alphaproteobacteria bacterium]